jgi:hypothetical protein
MELEAGRWYKLLEPKGWYMKYSHIDYSIHKEGVIEASEYINRDEFNPYGGKFGLEGYYTYIPIDISEIEQYLPEDHPDLINTYVDKKEDLSYLESMFKKLNII